MFDVEAFREQIESIRAIAQRRGGTVFVDLPPPAAARDVTLCEAFFDVRLPASLKAVWERHDGFSIRAYGADDPPNDPVATYRFDLRSPAAMLEYSRYLRSYFESMREAGTSSYTEQRARAFADVVDFEDADRRTVLDLSRRREDNGEAPVLEANVYEAWPDATTPPIAESVTELIERCLGFMIETKGGGFHYWWGPYYDW
jgi:hypothetical protein